MKLSILARTAHRTAAWLENTILTLLLTGMIFLGFLQIALRNIADLSINWGDPMLRILVLWIALAGSIAATREDNHIRIDLLARLAPERLWGPIKRLTDLFSAIVCGVIAWHSVLFVQMEQQDGTIAFSGIPAWMLELILPIGFGVMAIRFLAIAIVPVDKSDRKELKP